MVTVNVMTPVLTFPAISLVGFDTLLYAGIAVVVIVVIITVAAVAIKKR